MWPSTCLDHILVDKVEECGPSTCSICRLNLQQLPVNMSGITSVSRYIKWQHNLLSEGLCFVRFQNDDLKPAPVPTWQTKQAELSRHSELHELCGLCMCSVLTSCTHSMTQCNYVIMNHHVLKELAGLIFQSKNLTSKGMTDKHSSVAL